MSVQRLRVDLTQAGFAAWWNRESLNSVEQSRVLPGVCCGKPLKFNSFVCDNSDWLH